MLVLSRKTGEKIQIGDEIKLTIVRIGPNNVRVGIDAPAHLNIVREELIGVPQVLCPERKRKPTQIGKGAERCPASESSSS